MAEGERTEESSEPENGSGDGGGSSKGKMDDAPGGASVPADGVGDWDPPHESEDESNFSDTDAMGQEKRRTIIGQGYGPSRGRQFLYYGIFLALLVAAFFGGKIAVGELDKAPAKDTDQAPWTGTQVPPKAFE